VRRIIRLVKRAGLLLLLVPALAHAEERSTVVTVAGMLGAIEGTASSTDYYIEPEPLVGPRITLSWENTALALPDARGYKFDGALVPELVGGAYFTDERAQAFIGAGLRAELRMSQREMGLFKISARGAVYLAGRGLVVGDNRKPYGELALGEYFLVGKSTRIGFEFAAVFTKADQMIVYDTYNDDGMRSGGMVQIFLGWGP
jgi:hypothetical protein